MYDILSDFTYWLSFIVLSFSDDTAITQKSLFLDTYLWDISLKSSLFSSIKHIIFTAI